MWQISYLALPANGASQGDYFLPKSDKLAQFLNKVNKIFSQKSFKKLFYVLKSKQTVLDPFP